MRIPVLTQLLSVRSMMRYLPPKGTEGFDRVIVNGCNLCPPPPASIIASTLPKSNLQPPIIVTYRIYADNYISRYLYLHLQNRLTKDGKLMS